ncbi:hypothetical protein RRG08_040415 [Elysia crispata]|uniref:Fucolectin tachylectin-4 pentraxin-1 domain-containing protein n=1 Tax=Elysia crispata TaxID=231223 RepID=A0AAE1DDW0_9GAST|nr:hypothetical protein RRG08_040415 [Elysia crispata]
MFSGFAWLLLAVVFTALISNHISSAHCQVPGWFGNGCRYQCHCVNSGACNATTGSCPNGCNPGWFGPACQYVSSKFSPSGTGSNLTWLTDNDPGTCNDGNLHTITLVLDTPQPLTWLRLVVNDPDLLNHFHDVQHQYIGILGCSAAKTARVDDHTIDVACDTTYAVSHVTLTGSRLETLCSLYISGGRNVALKQPAKLGSTFGEWTADKAVDGITHHQNTAQTCAHTLERPAWWALNFNGPVRAMQFKMFSRQDCCLEQLVGFQLDAFHKISDTINVFSYIDATSKLSRKIEYTITPTPIITKSVKRVYIAKSANSQYLTICELMVFGDSVCESSKFGRECERQCNCAGQKPCFVSTGGCPSGCAPGFMGQDCSIACPRGRYGSGCLKACSVHCDGRNKDCDARDGTCLTGCEPGYLPPKCDLKCNTSTFGKRCEEMCTNCLRGDCNHLTGKCKSCPPNFVGDYCEQAVATAKSVEEVAAGISNISVIVIVVVFVALCSAVTIISVCLIVKKSSARVPDSQYDIPMGPVTCGGQSESLPQNSQSQRDSYLFPSIMQPLPENIYEMP